MFTVWDVTFYGCDPDHTHAVNPLSSIKFCAFDQKYHPMFEDCVRFEGSLSFSCLMAVSPPISGVLKCLKVSYLHRSCEKR